MCNLSDRKFSESLVKIMGMWWVKFGELLINWLLYNFSDYKFSESLEKNIALNWDKFVRNIDEMTFLCKFCNCRFRESMEKKLLQWVELN